MKNILYILFFCISSVLFAQSPPPPSIPTVDNKILIDELITVTEFENYFNNYCKSKVEQTAKENNWDDKKKQEIINSIKFKYFADTIYNAFASDSVKNLQLTIRLFTELNATRSTMTKLVPINPMIQYNIEGFVKSLLQGKYILPQ